MLRKALQLKIPAYASGFRNLQLTVQGLGLSASGHPGFAKPGKLNVKRYTLDRGLLWVLQ